MLCTFREDRTEHRQFHYSRKGGGNKAKMDSMDREESLVVVICKVCAMFMFLPQIDMAYTFNKCKLVALLEEKVRGLEWRVSTLQRIRDGKEFLDTTATKAQEIEEQQEAEAEVEYAEGRKDARNSLASVN